MATTRIIPMHTGKGKTIAQCLSDRTAYGMNPEKTNGGELITTYACDPHTADAEFLLAKREYMQLTGREQKSDVIAYQIRQSFKPGDKTRKTHHLLHGWSEKYPHGFLASGLHRGGNPCGDQRR